MSLLLVEAQPRIPAVHNNPTTEEDLLVVAVSVTDADGNPREGLTDANVNFTLVTGGLSGTVDDFVDVDSGLYGLQFSAGQPATAGGPFPSFLNSLNVFAVAITDGSDNGQTLVQINVSGRP